MRSLIALVVLAAACGSKGGAPAVDNRSGEHAEVAETPREILAELANAAAADDGPLLDALIHPEHGLWIWVQPGAYVVPAQLLKPDGTPPSTRLSADVINDYWRQELWKFVAGPIERGLPVMDANPADRNAAVYGDCGNMEAGAQRSWIVTEDLGRFYGEVLAESQVTLAPVMSQGLVHFRNWGLDVWMAFDRDRWWVAHVMVWTPCDA